ncbi:ABC transporter transmembrane domain-containing protein, partial [Tessaracoccus lubricantis]
MSEPTLDAGRAALSRWLLGVTRPVLAPLAASTVFRLVDLLAGLALFGVGVAAVVRFAGDDAPSLWALASTMIGLSLLKAVSRYLEQFLGHLVAFRALELLRREMFARLWPQAPAVMSRSRSGDLLERATKDVDRLEVFFAHTFAPAVTAVLAPAVAVTVIGATVSWPLAGIAAAGLATTLVAVPMFEARLARRAADYTGTLRGRLTHSVTDSVQGLVEVTGYGLQQQRLADAGTIEAELEQVGARAARTA